MDRRGFLGRAAAFLAAAAVAKPQEALAEGSAPGNVLLAPPAGPLMTGGADRVYLKPASVVSENWGWYAYRATDPVTGRTVTVEAPSRPAVPRRSVALEARMGADGWPEITCNGEVLPAVERFVASTGVR